MDPTLASPRQSPGLCTECAHVWKQPVTSRCRGAPSRSEAGLPCSPTHVASHPSPNLRAGSRPLPVLRTSENPVPRGTRQAQWVELAALDLRVVSSSPTLGAQITKKINFKIKQKNSFQYLEILREANPLRCLEQSQLASSSGRHGVPLQEPSCALVSDPERTRAFWTPSASLTPHLHGDAQGAAELGQVTLPAEAGPLGRAPGDQPRCSLPSVVPR